MNIERALSLHSFNRPVQNGFDYLEWPVIRATGDCDWELVTMEWGFIPPTWRTREEVKRKRAGYKDERGKFYPGVTTLNARGEELLSIGKMYKDAAYHRRCLFLSTGFFEWRHENAIGKKGQVLKSTNKYPHHVRVKGQEVFFIAGIWNPWTDQETGETVDTCALITTKANELMTYVHNSQSRMPTILTEKLAEEWISDYLPRERITQIATFQFPSEKMEAYPVRKDFLTAEDPTERTAYPELTPAELF